MDVVPFGPAHVRAAAAIHAARVRSLRESVRVLPPAFEDAEVVAGLLAGASGVAAVDGGRLVGFLTARHPVPRFRRTGRTGAYVPEWGHGVGHDDPDAVYRAMYAAVTPEWGRAGCDVHAVTVLATDRAATDAWFRMGFGMLLTDAVVTDRPNGAAPARTATSADAAALAALDREHVHHYALPPTSMVPPEPMDEPAWRVFLDAGRGVASIVDHDGGAAGFMRFSDEHGGAALSAADGGAFVDGAYVRHDQRGRGLAGALLAAGLDELDRRGVTHVAVDYETTNPQAAAFWPRWTTPVCRSLQRILER